MRHSAIFGTLGVLAMLGAAPAVEAKPVKPHRATATRVKPVAETQTPAPKPYSVIRRHKCIVGCG